MKKKKLLFNIVIIFITVKVCFAAEGCFSVMPFKVGQFVEYRIISLENLSQENRYLISVVDEERLDGVKHFWIQLDIYGDQIREISFRTLVPSYNSNDFAQNPREHISEGLFYLFKKAKRMIIISRNGEEYEIDKNDLFQQPNILSDTFYMDIPDEKNRVDYSKLKYSDRSETIKTPVDDFQCFHFQVATANTDEYYDEGFDLWRSPKVPFLGIVRMEFSKTEYFKKQQSNRNKALNGMNIFERFFAGALLKNSEYKDRKDVYTMELVAMAN
jgi:hypothetical protein